MNDDFFDDAGELYEEYCLAVGGKAHDGKTLPSWKEFANDPAKEKQKNGWIAVAKKSYDIYFG